MDSYAGIIELVLIFGLVMGLGLQQLYSLRKSARHPGEPTPPDHKPPA